MQSTVSSVADQDWREQYVAIIGDQSETQVCFGPFETWDDVFNWADATNLDRDRVSIYTITKPGGLSGE